MSVILLTGFEPWHDFPVNASWETVARLDGQEVAGRRVVARRLPVSYGRLDAALRDAMAETAPDVCIGFGMEPRGTRIRLERVAVNLADAADYPDNDGVAPREGAVVPGAPAAYFSGLPLTAIQGALTAAGLDTVCSLTAGAFLCNACFYRTMHLAAVDRPGLIGGFVHIPPVADTIPGMDGWPLDRLVAAARVIVDATVGAA